MPRLRQDAAFTVNAKGPNAVWERSRRQFISGKARRIFYGKFRIRSFVPEASAERPANSGSFRQGLLNSLDNPSVQTVAFPLVDRKIIARYPISLPPRNLIREVNSEYSFFIFNALLKSVLTLFVYVGFFPDKKNRHIRTLNGAIDQFPGSRIPFFSRFVPDGFVEKYGFCRTLVFARVVNQSPISIVGISEGKIYPGHNDPA